MTKKQSSLIILLSIIIILLLALVLLWEFKRGDSSRQANSPTSELPIESNTGTTSTEVPWEENEFRRQAPVNVKVPEAGEEIALELREIIAVPEHAIPAAPGSDSKVRIFNIRAEGDKFIPSQIIVNHQDVVHIEFTAVDKDYDITLVGYNMMQRAKQGESKTLEFQALKEGTFSYFCNACGGQESTARGEIIVAK